MALAECCIFGGQGARVGPPDNADLSAQESLFSESQSRIVLSAAPAQSGALIREAGRLGVPVAEIGRVGGDALSISVNHAKIDLPVARLREAYEGTLKCLME